MGEPKEVLQLNLSPPNPYSILITGKINIYMGDLKKAGVEETRRDRQ